MREILFIKTSSMGDVLHHMPALTDARRVFPTARFSWIVDENYAPLARLHPAADEIIPIAVRRWRRNPIRPVNWREAIAALRTIRSRDFDAIIDTQGLVRTAVLAKLARGKSHGYDTDSIREPFASRFYDVRYKIGWDLHVIARNRTLTARALGYDPAGPPEYGFDRTPFAVEPARPYAVLFHATANVRKEWPPEHWLEVGRDLAQSGLEVVLPWGNARERARSDWLAANIRGARVPELRPILDVGKLIAGAKIVVGVDTGFLHLAAALGVPVVAVFTITKSHTAIPLGPAPVEMVGADRGMPEVAEVLAAVGRVVGR